MIKAIFHLFLLVFVVAYTSQSIAAINPNLPEKKIVESDSLSISKNKNAVHTKEVKSTESASSTFWQKNEEVEEDSTSNSALSFNFIYYVIEKFKFQVE